MADTPEVDPSLTGESVNRNKHFCPGKSSVLDLVLEEDDRRALEESRSRPATPHSRNDSRCSSAVPLPALPANLANYGLEERRGSRYKEQSTWSTAVLTAHVSKL